jgi:hypothetical protein
MKGGAVGHNFEMGLPKDYPWSPFNIVSDSPALHSKWLLLLKIEISLVVSFRFITNAGLIPILLVNY